jgi:hypothetical protein
MEIKKPPKLADEYAYIVRQIVPAVVERFVSKGGDYGDAWKLLGTKGQFSDINRKFWKLYYSIWLDRPLVGEQADECAEDIIGHCLLLLYLMENPPTPDRGAFSSPESDESTPLPASDPLGYPELPEVLAAIRSAAAGASRTGSALDRIIDSVIALYGRREHGLDA